MKESIQSLDRGTIYDLWLLRAAEQYLLTGPGSSLKTAKGRKFFHDFVTRLYYGRRAPLSFYGPRILDRFETRVLGTENVSRGSGILVANHPADGPLKGNWVTCLLNGQAREEIGDLGEPRWIQREEKFENSDGMVSFAKNLFFDAQRRVFKRIGFATDAISFSEKVRQSGLAAAREIMATLASGQKVVLCPEGQDSNVLCTATKQASEFLEHFAKRGVAIWPVAFWYKADGLNITIGGDISPDMRFSKNAQNAGDQAMAAVARLLPEERRGVYARRF